VKVDPKGREFPAARQHSKAGRGSSQVARLLPHKHTRTHTRTHSGQGKGETHQLHNFLHNFQNRPNLESKRPNLFKGKKDVPGKRDVGGKTGSKAGSGALNAGSDPLRWIQTPHAPLGCLPFFVPAKRCAKSVRA
jgi:hypothetical protein